MIPTAADVAVVGGGLCGLALAAQLVRAGVDVQLFEARDRFGGRARSEPGPDGAAYDLGPSWIWPQNRRVRAVAAAQGLTLFEQHSAGRLIFQDETGATQPYDFATMAGSLRIDGGVGALADALAATIPDDRLRAGCAIRRIADGADGLRLEGAWGACDARRVVVAAPPRVAATIAFDPPLPPGALAALTTPPTWMAGHAKLVAVYSTPFWREAGLSGDGVSRRGPLAEIHDASPRDLRSGALFGFVGTPAEARAGRRDAVIAAAVDQLRVMFGPGAGAPDAVLYADWAEEPATATAADAEPPMGHPTYRPAAALEALWGGRLRFSVTELAPEDAGFIEGAFAAAEVAAAALGA
ncbi:MAG: FAD-dependent oxidoreductase [Pseudomonadota bacterium]